MAEEWFYYNFPCNLAKNQVRAMLLAVLSSHFQPATICHGITSFRRDALFQLTPEAQSSGHNQRKSLTYMLI